MEVLTTLSTKVFTNGTHHSRALSSSRAQQSKICLQSTPFNLNFQKCKTIRSVASDHHPSSRIQGSKGLENLKNGIKKLDCLETVNVKFILKKECCFGEHFLLVGEDPILGSWNPSNAIPLNWSDGHQWSVEVDLPEETLIHFKFVLKQSKGDIMWQPGPDRTLRTWKTANTIVISEEWKSAEAQKITDGIVVIQNRESTITSEENLMSSKSMVESEDRLPVTGEEKEIATENDERGSISKSFFKEMTEDNGRVEEEEGLFTYGEGSVLVPGLSTPIN